MPGAAESVGLFAQKGRSTSWAWRCHPRATKGLREHFDGKQEPMGWVVWRYIGAAHHGTGRGHTLKHQEALRIQGKECTWEDVGL